MSNYGILADLTHENFFEAGQTPCTPISHLFDVFNAVVNFIDNYLGVRRNPAIIREGRRTTLDQFKDLVKVWIELQRNTNPILNLRDLMYRVIGTRSYRMTLKLRYYMFYVATTDTDYIYRNNPPDIVRRIMPVRAGVLYNPFKYILHGSYEERSPFEFQVEFTSSQPVLYYNEQTDEVCIDTNKLRQALTNTLNALSGVYLPGYSVSFVEIIMDRMEAEGVEWMKGKGWWSFEYNINNRWVTVGIEKLNLYGGYETFQYYVWGVRDAYPNDTTILGIYPPSGLTSDPTDYPRGLGVAGVLVDFEDSTLYKASGWRRFLEEVKQYLDMMKKRSGEWFTRELEIRERLRKMGLERLVTEKDLYMVLSGRITEDQLIELLLRRKAERGSANVSRE